jgi:ribosomal protein L14
MPNIIIHRRHHTVTAMAMAGKLGTAARRVIRCRAAIVRRIEVPAEADGVLGTAVRRATPSKAVVVHPIQVRSAARRADGTAIEFKRTRAQRSLLVRLSRRNFASKIPASDVVPADIAGDRLNRGN